MKHRTLYGALLAAALLIGGSVVMAAAASADQAAAPQAPVSKVKASAKSTNVPKATQAKPTAAAKLVDINSASIDDLKKLTGIGDAEATKIIAGRPYGSKAWLVTHNVIDSAVYEQLKTQVEARQTDPDVAKKAATDKSKTK